MSSSIKFFVAPYGMLQDKVDGDGMDISLKERIDNIVDNEHIDYDTEVTSLVDDLFNNAKDINSSYDLLQHPKQWVKEEASIPAYSVETDNVKFTVSVRSMPTGMLKNAEDYVSCYVFLNFYSKNSHIRSVYGMGFYTEDKENFTQEKLSLYLVHYVQNLIIKMSEQAPGIISQLEDAALEKISDWAWDKAGKIVTKYVPGPVIKVGEFLYDPSAAHAITVAENVAVALVPSVIGKVLLYVAFQVLNYIFADHYKIRYALINRLDNISYRVEEAHKDYTGKLPEILTKDAKDNVMHRNHQTPYFSALDDSDSVMMGVFQAPTFLVGNNGSACPDIMVRMEQFDPDTTDEGRSWRINNILSAYDIVWTDDNYQGVGIYPDYRHHQRDSIYDHLTSHSHKRCIAKTDNVVVTQVTNAINGRDNETYDALVIIDPA